MNYTADISRNNPTCFLFLVDQSLSMTEMVGGMAGVQKAKFVAYALNRTLYNLVSISSRVTGLEQEIRDYFYVGVIGYGAHVGPAFAGSLAGQALVPISEIGYNPARIETRTRKIPDGAGGIISEDFRFPIWFEPVADGATPMNAAFELAGNILERWVAEHPDSFPPIVINLTDGMPTDADPRPMVERVRSLATRDGNPLLLNLHTSALQAQPILYPSAAQQLPPDPFANWLWDSSSVLTTQMLELANQYYPGTVRAGSRGFVFNADIEAIVNFLEIGTRASVRSQIKG